MKNFYSFLGFCSLVLAIVALFASIVTDSLFAVLIAMLMSLDCAILAVGAAFLAREK
jgi:hypothetical protein